MVSPLCHQTNKLLATITKDNYGSRQQFMADNFIYDNLSFWQNDTVNHMYHTIARFDICGHNVGNTSIGIL